MLLRCDFQLHSAYHSHHASTRRYFVALIASLPCPPQPDLAPSQDYDLIEPNSITYFLNTAAGELDFFWEGVEFLTFCWEDRSDFDCFDKGGIVVDQIVSFVDEGVRLGQSVLVYSARGQSRSVACVAAYMMAKYGWSCDKVFEFFDSKRLPMDLVPGLIGQLHDLDWRLQRRRLAAALALPTEGARKRCLEANRSRLLTWRTGVALLGDPLASEDLSFDQLVLVNSFVNGQSALVHSHAALPRPPQGDEARKHVATVLRWIDEGTAEAEMVSKDEYHVHIACEGVSGHGPSPKNHDNAAITDHLMFFAVIFARWPWDLAASGARQHGRRIWRRPSPFST